MNMQSVTQMKYIVIMLNKFYIDQVVTFTRLLIFSDIKDIPKSNANFKQDGTLTPYISLCRIGSVL